MTDKNNYYQGRQTTRKGSTERRVRILEAAMRIIVRDGTRGVRHRAVAAEADVPLAATTYYFEHINDLISDAFVLFYERLRMDDCGVGEACYQFITSDTHKQLELAETRAEVPEQLARMITAHIESQVSAPEDRILEMTFRSEALHNPVLRELVDSNLKEVHWLIERSLREIDSNHSATDARTIAAVMDHLKYISTLAGGAEFNSNMVYKTLLRVIRMVMCREAAEVV
jgi:DNA-binding transcriptional regulator YbjK